ncbi:GNAT family N-acetyltransferase [Brevibacillus sp. NRS-1366]|uniref:GNAT family N-acetyltransferase n=1 Tax=Brevibacillus sp. NRS-1366 TaxID=3233899 RepID=UPI003D1EB4D1
MIFAKNMVHGKELTSESFHRASNLFESLTHHISIKGVITGSLQGRVFLANDGTAALLTSPQGIFLGGSTENKLFLEETALLFKEELLPKLASERKLDYILFYPSDGIWESTLEVVLQPLLPMKSGRMTFTHDLHEIDIYMEEGIVAVNGDFLNRQDVMGLDDLLDEIHQGWSSVDAFAEKGFGCAAIQDTNTGPTIISWCLTDWVVDDECEFGIATEEGYRGKGWARKTALGALSLAKQRGMKRVGWQCWSSNVGSQKTALSVGFRLLADYSVLFGWNRPLNNLLVNGNYYMHGDRKVGVEKDYARAAWSYDQALSNGWDWNGDVALYWNAACMFYLIGEPKRAKDYYQKAVEKGWIDIHQPHYHDFVYREADSEQIARILSDSQEDSPI